MHKKRSDNIAHASCRKHTLLEVLRSSLHELHGNQLEPAGFEARDDGADKTALDTVRLEDKMTFSDDTRLAQYLTDLDHDVGALNVGGHIDDGLLGEGGDGRWIDKKACRLQAAEPQERVL